MQEVFARAGFDDMRPHDLRHSFATELKLLGVPTRKIQLALGHTTEAITEHYLGDLDAVTIETIQKKYVLGLQGYASELSLETYSTFYHESR